MSNLEVSRLSETKMNPLTMSAETKSYLQFTGEYSIANADSKAVVASGPSRLASTSALPWARATGKKT